MNPRIQELIAQATTRPHRDQGFNGEPTHVYPGTLDPEKLAELIAHECMECVRDVLRDEASDLTYAGAEQVQSRIRQVFDIQE